MNSSSRDELAAAHEKIARLENSVDLLLGRSPEPRLPTRKPVARSTIVYTLLSIFLFVGMAVVTVKTFLAIMRSGSRHRAVSQIAAPSASAKSTPMPITGTPANGILSL
jgi:hypothetical protein